MATATRARARTTFGPADHGRRVTASQLDAAEYVPGFKYEVIDGRLYASPQPNPPEHALERWLRRAVDAYADAHPDVINFVATKGRVFLPDAARLTVPEPDLAAYAHFPVADMFDELKWDDVSPVLVGEVLVGGSIEKDLGRNPPLYLAVPTIKEYWVLNGSESASEPSLIQHRRRGKRWAVAHFPYRSTLITPLLPGFSLVIDPRK